MQSFFDPEVLNDPYPYYASLRAAGRAVWAPEMTGGSWLVAHYDDVLTLLRHPGMSADRTAAYQMFTSGSNADVQHMGEQMKHYMIFRDPPDHTRLRALVTRAFSPQVVAALRPRIERIVAQLLDAKADSGKLDVIADLAFPLPATVILEMLGAPHEDQEMLRGHLEKVATFFGHLKGMKAAGAVYGELERYIAELIDLRRRNLGDDLISAFIRAEDELGALLPGELTANAILLLLAGHHTTMNLIGNGLLALLRHPDELVRMKEDPTLLPGAVEELLRYDSPVQLVSRVAKEDLVIGSQPIEAGAIVHLILGGANRDPARFADPDRFDATRRDPRHLSFAFGAHFCVGAALARLEAEVAFGALLSRFARIEHSGGPLVWQENVSLRGLKHLHVTTTPRA